MKRAAENMLQKKEEKLKSKGARTSLNMPKKEKKLKKNCQIIHQKLVVHIQTTSYW